MTAAQVYVAVDGGEAVQVGSTDGDEQWIEV